MPLPTRGIPWLLSLLAIALPALAEDRVRLAISGGDKAIRGNVRAHLALDQLPCQLSERQLLAALRGADDKVRDALRALGYYHGSWTISHDRETRNDKPCWIIAVAVDPGTATTLGTLELSLAGEGRDNPTLQASLAQSPLSTGERLHHGHYEDTKKLIRQAALSQGYFDGRFTESTLRVDRHQRLASAILVFDTGPRYRIGRITLADTPLADGFIGRYFTVQPGEPFDARKLIQLQSNLISSQYFNRVSVDQAEPNRDDGTVDIHLDLEAKSRYESVVGAGFSTDLGPRLNYQLHNRRVNDDGDTYRFTTQLSPVKSHVGFQYQQPGADPINEYTLWSTGWQRQDNDTYTSDSYSAEASRVRVSDNGWVRTISLNFLMEDFDIASEGDSVVVVYPGIHWRKSRANNSRYPTRGWRLATGARGGADQLLSDTSFLQAQAGAKIIWPLLGGRLLARADLGTTLVDDFAKLPASLRFYAGGDNSIRGYDYESLGPTNEQGEVTGGKHLLAGSLEYDRRVYGDYSLAVFYDAGNAFNNQEFTYYESAGLGVRWLSPIGTIRLDLAFALNDDSFRFHISMGPDL